MALKITIKPNEIIYIGQSTVTVVSNHSSILLIEGKMPVLRSEYAIEAQTAHSTTQKLHYILQEMYLSENIEQYQVEYFSLATQLLKSSPEAMSWIGRMNGLLIDGRLYEAVKLASQHASAEDEKQIEMDSAIGS